MATKKDLLVLLIDVGEHMQPYLPLLHRMVFSALNVKLLSKPNHEVAVVLYGTKGTCHKLYDPLDPASYHHVTVLRPLQNLSSYLELEPFAFAADPQQHCATSTIAAIAGMDPSALAEAEAVLCARVEAAGLAGRDAAASCGRAARLFGPPGLKADWGDGLVVAMDVLASALGERFETSKKEANKLGQLRILLVSNLLGQSEPFEDDFRSALVDTCNSRGILLEVMCLDHYVPPLTSPSPLMSTSAAVAAAMEDADPLALLPPALAAVRRSNLEQLHLLKAELRPAAFRHLRQPAELLCLFRSKEVSYQASNAVFMLSPPPIDDQDATSLPPPLKINIKLYKKIRRTIVDEWKTCLGAKPDAAGAMRGGGDDNGDGAGAGSGGGGDGGGGAIDRGFVREVEYEDPTTGQKFSRDDNIIKGFSYGKQVVPIPQYDEYGEEADEQMRKFTEKDFSLLGFVDAGSVPHHRLIDEPHVVLGDSAASAVAIASLALTLNEQNKAGLVRFIFRKQSPQLGLLTPHLSASPDVPHALLLSPLPFAEDIRTYTFSTFRNEQEARDLPRLLAEARGEVVQPPPLVPRPPSAGDLPSQLSSLSALSLGNTAPEPALRFERLQPDADQQDAALALVRALDLGPTPLPGGGARVGGSGCARGEGGGAVTDLMGEPHGEALAPEVVPNPVVQRAYALVTSRALDPMAQLLDPEEDPMVELVLQPHGRYWPAGAKDAIRRAEEKLQTRDRVADGKPAAKRARREEGGDAAVAAVTTAADIGDRGHTPEAAAVVVFDPTAPGGTVSARVSKVSELNAMEDFRAMLAQGRDSASEAVRQMKELVRELVSRSIGDQLYDKAAKCVQALREGCAASGRAGAFNSFLRELVIWCKSEDRAVFVSQLGARGVSLISAEELDQHRPTRVSGAAADAIAAGHSGSAGGGDAAARFEDDGGAVAPREARRFLDQMLGPEEVEVEATLPAVQQDEEFEDMD